MHRYCTLGTQDFDAILMVIMMVMSIVLEFSDPDLLYTFTYLLRLGPT